MTQRVSCHHNGKLLDHWKTRLTQSVRKQMIWTEQWINKFELAEKQSTLHLTNGECSSLQVYLETMKTDHLRGINAKIKINKRWNKLKFLT